MYFPVHRGGERHVQEVSERLAARGHEVAVVTTDAASDIDLYQGIPGALPKRESVNGVRVTRVPTDGNALGALVDFCLQRKGGYRSLNYLFTPAGLRVLSRRPSGFGFLTSILRSNADVVVSWNWFWPSAYHAHLARAIKRFRLVGIPFFHTAESWVHEPLYDRMMAACNAIGVNTEYEKQFIQERVPDMRNIAVLGPGIEAARFAQRDGAAFRSRHGLGSAPMVGFVGGLGPNKGVDKIVDAMQVVWRWNPEVRLLIGGFRVGNYPALDQALNRLSPEERRLVVSLPDFAEAEKADLYDALDVFVMPSTGESFGISYLEAWICRKPVIGARIGPTACVIEEGADGLLADPDDCNDIGRAMVDLLRDPERRAQMGARGQAKTLEHFTWERIADRMEAFLLTVTTERPKTRRQRRQYAKYPAGASFDEPARESTGTRSESVTTRS